jgi:ParB family chromosome partitioning protein
MRLETIRLSRLDLKDDRFRISYFFNTETMSRSIREAGLVNPPLVRPGGERFVLVSGWKRVMACRETGLREIPALLTEEKNDLRLFLAVLHENLANRSYTLTEKAVILEKLLSFGVKRKKVIGEFMPLLALPATSLFLRHLLTLSRAHPKVKRYFQEKDRPLPIWESLLCFSDSERLRLLPVIAPLGQNKAKELLDNLWEVSRRDGLPLRRLLDDKDIRAALRAERLSPVQKAERVRRLAARRRYPRLSAQQDSFFSALRKMSWPSEITVQPSPYFEDENVTVAFRFKTPAEFRERLLKLERLKDSPDLAGLFRE